MRSTSCWLVALSALGLCVARPTPARAQVPDHLKCYKVKDSLAKTTYSADLGGLIAEPGCTIKVPALMACVPSTKTNVNPTPPGGGGSGTPNAFGCYKIKCPKATLPTIPLDDQFGSRVVTPSTPKLLCAPAAATTTTSTTRPLNLCTTTTIPLCGPGPPPHTCPPNFGACPGGQTCQTDATGCSCVGPPPACDSAGVFFCGTGTCPAGQACQTVCGADGNLSCQCH